MKQANNPKLNQWLTDHNIMLNESFPSALRRLSKQFQAANGIRTLQEVYRIIGIKKEYLYYWEQHPYNTQTKKNKIYGNSFCCQIFWFKHYRRGTSGEQSRSFYAAGPTISSYFFRNSQSNIFL